MKLNSIINRYIFIELAMPFSLNVLFFMFIFLLTEILEITNMIVNYKVALTDVIWLLIYSMPYFLVFVLPMSVMMAVLLTFLRMSSDNEIIALKSSGVGVYQLLPPVVCFCLAGALLTGFMTIYGLPWSRASFKEMTIKVAKSNIDIGLKERTFNTSFKGVMLYVNKIDLKNKELVDVFIQDERTPKAVITVVAPKGKMTIIPDKLLFHMRLYNGVINHVVLEDRSANTIRFDTYDLQFDLREAAAKISREPIHEKEMSLTQLKEKIKNSKQKNNRYYSMLIEFHRKFSIPFACIALGILAIPLGIHSKSAKKSFGLAVGLFMFLLYYLMLSAGVVFGEAGKYPPVIAMWMPNLVTLGVGWFLLTRTVKGKPIYIDAIPRMIKWFRNDKTI